MNSKFSSTNGLEVVSLFFIENLRSLTFICCLFSTGIQHWFLCPFRQKHIIRTSSIICEYREMLNNWSLWIQRGRIDGLLLWQRNMEGKLPLASACSSEVLFFYYKNYFIFGFMVYFLIYWNFFRWKYVVRFAEKE